MNHISFSLIAIVLIVFLVIVIVTTGYVKAPADKAFIISGLKKEPKVLIGRAGIKIPFLERKDELILKQISIDIKTGGYVPTFDFIGVDIDAVAKVRVLTGRDVPMLMNKYKTLEVDTGDKDEDGRTITSTITFTEAHAMEMVNAAMRNFLNMNENEIIEALTDSLQGNMREIIGAQTLKALCQNRKAFGDEVQDKAQKDMNALGIWIESCNIQKLEDEKDLINALGMDNMAQIQKNASIAKAEADRDVAMAQAEAERIANEAKVKSQTEIAIKQNELSIKKADLKAQEDTKQARADAAYKIQEQEQQKTIQTKVVEVEIVKAEKEADLKKQEVLIKQQILEAEIQKKAEADKFAIERDAEAKLAQKRAEAEALRYSLEQEAIGIKAKGEAEATAIRAKGEAEALAMERKADAYKKYNNAAIVQMIVATLPSLASEIAKPLSSIDKVTIFGDGKVDSVSANVPLVLSQTFATVKEATGVDLADIVKANTYDAKVTKNINIASGNKELTDSITKVLKDLPESEQEKNE